jgi:hypothetical protein
MSNNTHITAVAINQTLSSIVFEEFGSIVVPPTGELVLTESVNLFEIQASESLYDHIETGAILLGDGITTYSKQKSLEILVPLNVESMSFGSNCIYEFSEEESSTTSSTSQHKVSLSANDLPYGMYRIGWYSEVYQSSLSDSVEARVELNNSITMGDCAFEPSDLADVMPFCGFRTMELSGTNIIDMDYRQQRGSTAYIKSARLEFWRLV